MKVAVPTSADNSIDSHFGHCAFFTMYTIDENKSIVNTEVVEAPQQCGCKSGIASVLSQKGVSVMLAGNMGPGAVNVLNNNGIEVYRGCSGDAVSVVREFIAGQIKDSAESCHGDLGHECGHH